MDDEIKELMEDYGFELEEAQEVHELMDEYGLDADDATELAGLL